MVRTEIKIKYMQYKLNEQDYRRLWFVATPQEIVAEFGARAHHLRHIYKIYARFEASQVSKKRKAMRAEEVGRKPDFVSKSEAEEIFNDALYEARSEHFKRMWEIIEEYENRWN